MAADIPAMVVGAGINGLGVARSLAAAGVGVWILDADARRAGMYTRAARPRVLPRMDGAALIEGLLNIHEKFCPEHRPVLMLTQEDDVKTVSEHRGKLESKFLIALPEKRLLRSLMHKEGFYRLAWQHGAPVPRLIHIRSRDDCAALTGLRFPIVLKPGERNAAYGREFRKAYRVETFEEAEALVKRILLVMPDVVGQEWIEGSDSEIYFCLQYFAADGVVAATFTGRKIRSWPPQVGGTASCVAAPEASDALSGITTRFFGALGVVGFAAMEYKRDASTEQFVMVEPTVGRTDYQAEVATLNGVNLPFAAYCSLLGRPVPAPSGVRRPVVWRDRDADRRSMAAQRQQRAADVPRNTAVRDALWRWRDPMPFVMSRFHRWLRSGTRRLSHARTQLRWLEGK